MAFSVGGVEKVRSEPNVVPLCDVLLVLLIIFMVVTPLVQKGRDVRLPDVLNTINMPDKLDVSLTIVKDGTIYLNQDTKPIALENLQNALEEAFLTVADKKLYLKADQDLEFGKIVEVIEVLKDAGIDVLGIITEKKTEKAD